MNWFEDKDVVEFVEKFEKLCCDLNAVHPRKYLDELIDNEQEKKNELD
jgi:hypothetical protein